MLQNARSAAGRWWKCWRGERMHRLKHAVLDAEALEQEHLALAVDDLPVRIGRVGHLEVGRQLEDVLVAVLFVSDRALVDLRAREALAGVRHALRERAGREGGDARQDDEHAEKTATL